MPCCDDSFTSILINVVNIDLTDFTVKTRTKKSSFFLYHFGKIYNQSTPINAQIPLVLRVFIVSLYRAWPSAAWNTPLFSKDLAKDYIRTKRFAWLQRCQGQEWTRHPALVEWRMEESLAGKLFCLDDAWTKSKGKEHWTNLQPSLFPGNDHVTCVHMHTHNVVDALSNSLSN